ncbi:MAG: PilZ domain-containing protein [Candidatus Omnitrophica bacterium]|nr:PilZ domain-containing protein [Candidatus Omnitrophota bacterium]
MTRQIGNVMIIDIKGAFTGTWALRGGANLRHAFNAFKNGHKVIFNLRQTIGLDTLGARFIFESTPREVEGGVLAGSSSVMDMFSQFPEARRFRIFQDEEAMVQAFGEEFVGTYESTEQRNSPRLLTALPLEFYEEGDGEKVVFRAIVTNLSDSGLLAEYIDLKIAEESLKRLNPYDLKTLHLTLFFPRRKVIQMMGNVVHRNLNGEQMGIGIRFTDVAEKDQDEIRQFLRLNSL